MTQLIAQYYVWLSGLANWLALPISNLADSINIPLVSALHFGLIGASLTKTGKIVVISSGGDGQSGAGITKVTKDVADVLPQLPAVVEALTGTNLIEALKNLPGVKGAATPKPEGTPPTEDTLAASAPTDQPN